MCIAIAKRKGIARPTNEQFENCFDSNRDGAGFCYAKDGTVTIVKGLMSYKQFIETLEKVEKLVDPTEHAFLYHFRIGTQGGNTKGNTHPFPISKSDKELKALTIQTEMAMIHNGIISETSGYRYKQKYPTLSDTQVYVKDFLYPFAKDFEVGKFLNYKSLTNIISDHLGSGKFAFLDNEGNITKLGSWIEEEGIYFSNKTYEACSYVNVGGRMFDKDDWWKSYNTYSNGNYKYKSYGIIEEDDEEDMLSENFLCQEIDVKDYYIEDFTGLEMKYSDLLHYGKLYVDDLGIVYFKDVDGTFSEANLYATKRPTK